MHHANHFYGHAHVLAEYCGLDPEQPPRIEGYLQHGWNVRGRAGRPARRSCRAGPIFVWSEQTRRRALVDGAPAGRRWSARRSSTC